MNQSVYALVRVVIRGGVERPTFRFSGIGTFPDHRYRKRPVCILRAASVPGRSHRACRSMHAIGGQLPA
jgi:hypothetical protein